MECSPDFELTKGLRLDKMPSAKNSGMNLTATATANSFRLKKQFGVIKDASPFVPAARSPIRKK